eukprot:15450056-Alexandrium_andersonii.AAC.1
MKAAPKLGAHSRLGHLRRERRVHVLVDVRMQVRLADIDEESCPGPAVATVSTAPPAGSQIRQEEP